MGNSHADGAGSPEIVHLEAGTMLYRGASTKNPWEYVYHIPGDRGNWFALDYETALLYAHPYVHRFLLKEAVDVVVVKSTRTRDYIASLNMGSRIQWEELDCADEDADEKSFHEVVPGTNMVRPYKTAPRMRNIVKHIGYKAWEMDTDHFRHDHPLFHHEIMFVDPKLCLSYQGSTTLTAEQLASHK
jgi:hypothetical protein